MDYFQISEETNHVNIKSIVLVLTGLLVLGLSYFYIPKIIDNFINPNQYENKASSTNQNTSKLKSLEDYLKQTSNPAPKVDLASESFGRNDPFADY